MCNHRDKAKPGRKICEKCRRSSLKRQRKKWAERLSKHLCVRCGKRKHLAFTQLCRPCRTYQSIRCVQYRKKHFFLCRAPDFHVEAQILWSLWKSQHGRCALTGVRLTRENAVVDHIIAKSKGGSNHPKNLRWTTEIANLAKNDMSDTELIQFCQQVLNHGRF